MKPHSEVACKPLLFALLAGSTAAASATGFRLPDQDAFATARGEAFVATADNSSAIYYNPAGITQLQGQNIRGGVYALDLNTTYHSPAGGSYDNLRDLHAIPEFFYTYNPENLPLAFGLGAYSPYGLSSKWPDQSGFNTIATEGNLTYMTVNPVVAWQITPALSIGGGPTINYSDIDLRQGLSPIPGNDEFRFRGDDTALGFNLGLLWHISPQFSFGASYHSETTLGYKGHTDTRVNTAVPPVFPVPFSVRQDAQASLPFPQNAIFGLSYRPTPDWNFEFNLDWTDWSRVNSVTISQGGTALPPLALGWQSSMYYEFGATRYLGKGWHVSAGYIYNENSVPNATYEPLVFDLNRHFWSLGAGFQGEHFGFDVAYQLGYGPTRTVSGYPPNAWGQSANGRFDFLSNALMLTAGWRF